MAKKDILIIIGASLTTALLVGLEVFFWFR